MAESPDPIAGTNGSRRRRHKQPRNRLQKRHELQIAVLRDSSQRLRMSEMRLAGLSYAQIAQEMGVAYQTVVNTVNTALKLTVEADRDRLEEVRQLELERLDKLWGTWFPKATQEEVWEEGRLVRSPNMAAAGLCLKIAKRRAELVGLDREQKVSVNVGTVNVSNDQLAQVVAMAKDPEAALALERLSALWAHGEDALEGDWEELGQPPGDGQDEPDD